MLTMNELFSGIGAQSAALKRLGKCFDVISTADTDKDAIASYAAIHCNLEEVQKGYKYPDAKHMADYLTERNIGYDFEKNKPYDWHRLISKKTGKANDRLKQYYLACVISNNQGDVCKIEKLDYADFWTYSFPCQDISVAGKQEGIERHTRSGLLYEVERLLNVSAEHDELPKYLMLENVKNLVGKKFKAQFEEWLQTLDELGYNNYWKILNAKHYGIPQNRERVFAISIRKDVDTGDFEFPEGFDNGLRLKDFLEDEVDEKFYINQEKTEKLISQIKQNNPDIKREAGQADGIYTNQSLSFTRPPLRDLSRCLKANVHDAAVVERTGIDKSYNNPKPIEIANCITAREDRGISNHQAEGTAVCIPCITPDREEKRQNGRRFKEDGDPMFTLTSQDRHGVLQVGNIVDTGNWKNPQRGRIYSAEGCSPSLNTVGGGGLEPKIVCEQRTDEGLRFFKDGCVGTLRTIDACGDKRVLVKEATKLGYAEATVGDSINIQFPNSDTRRGRVGHEAAQTLETSCNQAIIDVKPRKDIKELEKHCEYCGEKLERKRFNGRLEDFGVFNNRKYCDRECMRRAFVMVGENGQSWSTAHATARKINELFLQKDSCEICGGTQNLDIHHIDGNWQNNELSNLMCLCRSCHTKYEKNKNKECGYRIRKLTPRETWRLMGFTDEEFQKAVDAGVSNSQLYKLAGNSIVVDVLEYIFRNLLK